MFRISSTRISTWLVRIRSNARPLLLLWYAALALIIALAIAILCMSMEQRAPDFYGCVGRIVPWWTLLAAHSLVLLLHIEHGCKKPALSAWADILGQLLLMGAALLYLLSVYHWLILPAVVFVSIPLLIVTHTTNESANDSA